MTEKEREKGGLSRSVGLETISKIQDNVECYREKERERKRRRMFVCDNILKQKQNENRKTYH